MGKHVLLGEGTRDTAFLSELCTIRGIDQYEVAAVEGNLKFGKYIKAISAQSGFKDTCDSILIVSDNDESAGKSFELIKQQLNEIDFPSPTRPLEIAKKRDRPAVGVLMLPYPEVNGSNSGCLETLLIPAMHSANNEQSECVDRLMECIKVSDWPKKSSRDKLKVRCLISTVWRDDPMYGLPFCFKQEKGLIPLDHQIFDEVADVLRHFREWSRSDIKPWTEWKAANPQLKSKASQSE